MSNIIKKNDKNIIVILTILLVSVLEQMWTFERCNCDINSDDIKFYLLWWRHIHSSYL